MKKIDDDDDSILNRLILTEQKEHAITLGYKTLGEFEEAERLRNALAESTRENRLNTNLECDTNIIIDLPSNETPKIQNTLLETDDKIDNFIYSSDEEYDTNFQDLTIHSRFPEVSSRENEEILKDNENDSIWNQIPYGISERILEILCDVDTLGYLHQVSKHFFLFSKDETYHIICK